MKDKKKLFNNILVGILTFFLVCYTSFVIVVVSGLNVSKKYVNKDKLSNIINKIDISSIIDQATGDRTEQIMLIKQELLDLGISEESFKYLINSNDVQKFGTEIIINVAEQLLTDNNTNYEIDEFRVKELLQNNIPELQISSQFVDEFKIELNKKIDAKIPVLVEKINYIIDDFVTKLENSDTFVKYKNYINKSLDIFDFIYSDLINVTLIVVVITFIVLLIYLRKNIYQSIKWVSSSFLISSITLCWINIFIANKLVIESNIVKNITEMIKIDFNIYSKIYFIISIVLIIINIVLYITKKQRYKEVEGVVNEEIK